MGRLLKIERIGNEVGVVLPPEVLADLQAQLGDSVWIAKQTKVSAEEDADFQRQLAVAREVMQDYSQALRELAR